jgi:hypothetical protein
VCRGCFLATAVHEAMGIVLVVMTAQALGGETKSKVVTYQTHLRLPRLHAASLKSQ